MPRVHPFDRPPEGEARVWPDSVFVWDTETSYVYEIGAEFHRRLGTKLAGQEWLIDEITEVSLVDRPANRWAVIAMIK